MNAQGNNSINQSVDPHPICHQSICPTTCLSIRSSGRIWRPRDGRPLDTSSHEIHQREWAKSGRREDHRWFWAHPPVESPVRSHICICSALPAEPQPSPMWATSAWGGHFRSYLPPANLNFLAVPQNPGVLFLTAASKPLFQERATSLELYVETNHVAGASHLVRVQRRVMMSHGT